MLLLLAGVALGQQTDTPEKPEDGFAYTITVYGEPAIRQARWDLIVALKRQGWDPRTKSGGRTVFKPPRPWLGRAELDADGNLFFRYPVVRLRNARLSNTMPVDPTEDNPHLIRDPGGHVGSEGITLPAGQAGLWLLPSHRVLDGWYAKTREQVDPEIRTLRRAQRDTEVQEQLDALVDGLDALWADGTPLTGSATVPSDQRKAHVLAYWATRADSFAGQQATKTIETWLANNVELTEQERATWQARRTDGRELP